MEGTVPPVLTFCPGFKAGAIEVFREAPPFKAGTGPYVKYSYFTALGLEEGGEQKKNLT